MLEHISWTGREWQQRCFALDPEPVRAQARERFAFHWRRGRAPARMATVGAVGASLPAAHLKTLWV